MAGKPDDHDSASGDADVEDIWLAGGGDQAAWDEPTVLARIGEPEADAGQGSLPAGTLLNGIYQVRRYIGRGGMGEVFEGANINSDERVAIKVILPHLSADQNVRAMFRKEAGILTRITHPAVAQYRVLAHEPALGVLYIVTEFVDGTALADRIKSGPPASEQDLSVLLRRLAAGLEAAHDLGAVHRDITPDNILLPGGRLDQAKIIDFGIAKDLEAAAHTIVGDGFAGTLSYVAPEQFGAYGRRIGPWTDVWSLGLVMVCLARGKPSDMGATLVDAIDKRREGVDVSAAPEGLRPVLARMLAPDPADRFQSMREVLDALTAKAGSQATPAAVQAGAAEPRRAPPPPPPAATVPPTPAPKPRQPSPPWRPPSLDLSSLPRGPILAAGGALLALGLVGAAVTLWPHPAEEAPKPAPAPGLSTPQEPARAAAPVSAPTVTPAQSPTPDTVPPPALPEVASEPTPAPAPAPAPAKPKAVAPVPNGRLMVVYFPFDQTGLTPEAQSVVAGAAALARSAPGSRIVVVGHTDTSSSAAYSVRISERRAKSVADALVGMGVPGTALAVDWKGSTQLAVNTAQGVKEPLNRRVEIYVAPPPVNLQGLF